MVTQDCSKVSIKKNLEQKKNIQIFFIFWEEMDCKKKIETNTQKKNRNIKLFITIASSYN